jgi:putative PIN family toxin of toxin-antitoxin system
MTKVVIDTSVLVSALHTEHGANAAVLHLIIQGKLLWCVSEAVLAEYQEILSRRKFNYIDLRKITAALLLASSGQMTVVTQRLTHSPDESDNRFYECAQAAQADYIVTGNRRHFPTDLPPTKIVNARELLAILESGGKAGS